MTEYVVRFFLGGLVVSAFAMFGDLLRPKSFAGLFAAAPSVALATLAITLLKHGADYTAVESRAMIYGAVALAFFSVFVCQLLVRTRLRSLAATLLAMAVWLLVAFGLQFLITGSA